MNENNELLNKIDEIINIRARTTVGTILKKLEVLQSQHAYSDELFRALIKEEIYEQFRNLKEFIHIYLTIGKLEFKTKDPQK